MPQRGRPQPGWWHRCALLLAVLCLLLAGAPARSADDARVVPLRSGTLTDLASGHTSAVADFPLGHTVSPRRDRSFGLVLPFSLPDRDAASLWAVYFIALYEGGQVYVNGQLAGEAPTSTKDTAVLDFRPYLFTVPPALLRNGDNRIEVRWTTHNTLQFLAPVFVGPYDVVQPAYARSLFWRITLAQVSCACALVSAALLLGVYAMRREQRYLLMGLASLGWCHVCVFYFLPAMPAALYPWSNLLRIVCVSLLTCCSWLFFALESGLPHRRYKRLCLGWAALGPAAFLFNFVVNDGIFSFAIDGAWSASMVLLGLWSLGLLLRALLRQWDWRRAVYLSMGCAGLVAGATDSVMTALGASDNLLTGSDGYTTQVIAPAWFAAIVIVLLKDFADFLAHARAQNLLTVQRLREQEQELLALHEKEQQREREEVALRERQRIMQDIHDGLGSQLVSSLALSERGALDAAQTSALLRECIDDLRLAIDSLAAGEDSFAVMAGNLRFRMEPRLRAAGIALRWNSLRLADASSPAPSQTLPLLRILQESLGNALKHARASEIAVTIETVAEGLHLRVADNGTGFDPDGVRPGKGLHGMEKRARLLGARLTLSSTGHGTVLELLLPPAAPSAPL
ncbi:sensor histidine kinase [Pseudorhodoferax sp.]|uniref:sensor histidine kinase n=1 Tax=Pseudorhodoferax sp. TaxID=1993553 RepID=UPI002DD64780|nr:sensor histidine kinase [Pseudorhodoferax sp.]